MEACVQDHVYRQSGIIVFSTSYGKSCSLSIYPRNNQHAIMFLRVHERTARDFRISNESSTEVFSWLPPGSLLKGNYTSLNMPTLRFTKKNNNLENNILPDYFLKFYIILLERLKSKSVSHPRRNYL